MQSDKKILIISFSNMISDPRVLRQYNTLKNEYDVYTCGYDNKFGLNHAQLINRTSLILKGLLAFLRILNLYSLSEKISNIFKYKISPENFYKDYDLIIANDINSVPLAFNHFKGKKYYIDLHEYSTAEIDDHSFRKFIQKEYLKYLCRKYLHRAFAVTSVNDTISKKMTEEFNVKIDTISNAPFYADLTPSQTRNINIKVIHHGAAMRSRKIELMIETAKHLEQRFTIDFMLIPNEEDYFNFLKQYAEGVKNVRFIPPVKHEEIIKFCNSYDIGFFLLPPVNPNYEFALPNKFFEFVQSRLAIVTGPSPEMANLIRKYNLGITTRTFEPKEAAEKINKLFADEIMIFKKNSDTAAKELNFESNKNLFMKIITEALN